MKWYPQSKCNRTADISVLYNHEKPSIVYQCDDYHDYTYLLILLASIKKVELKGNHLKHVQLLDKCISSLFLITKEIIVATWSLDITSYINFLQMVLFYVHWSHKSYRNKVRWSFIVASSIVTFPFFSKVLLKSLFRWVTISFTYMNTVTIWHAVRDCVVSSTKKNRHLITWRHICVFFSALWMFA